MQELCIQSVLNKKLENTSRTWIFSGPMTVFKIKEIQDFLKFKKLNQELAGVQEWILDLKQVSQIDTAGLAYLLVCIRSSVQDFSCKLSMIYFPEKAERLMEAQGVTSLFKKFVKNS